MSDDDELGFGPLPPHNTEAEECVLGSVLIDSDALAVIANTLRAEDFYHPRNRDIYAVMERLRERGQAADFVTVSDELDRAAPTFGERVNLIGDLARLLSVVPTSQHIEHYAEIVRRCAVNRRVIRAAGLIAAAGYADPTPDDVAAAAQRILSDALAGAVTPKGGPVELGVVLREYLATIEVGGALASGAGDRVYSGFADLDRLVGGFSRGDMAILAARPSVGKTALACNIARNAAAWFNRKTLLFSVEMSRSLIARRFLSSEARVESGRIRDGDLTTAEALRVAEALDTLALAPIWIDDEPQIRLDELCARARRLHDAEQLQCIIIDYLGLVRGGRPGLNKVQEVTEISARLKALARELGVALLVLSQLNRGVEHRGSNEPMLSDLRDSGSLEQDADVVMFLTRQEGGGGVKADAVDLTVAKNRNGPTGRIVLGWDERITRFGDVVRVD